MPDDYSAFTPVRGKDDYSAFLPAGKAALKAKSSSTVDSAGYSNYLPSESVPGPSAQAVHQFHLNYLNTDNRTANVPIATAYRLAEMPSDQRDRDPQLAKMQPVSRIAILQRAHDIAREIAANAALEATPSFAMQMQAQEAGVEGADPYLAAKYSGQAPPGGVGGMIVRDIAGPLGQKRYATEQTAAMEAARFGGGMAEPESIAIATALPLARGIPVIGKAALPLLGASQVPGAVEAAREGNYGVAGVRAGAALLPILGEGMLARKAAKISKLEKAAQARTQALAEARRAVEEMAYQKSLIPRIGENNPPRPTGPRPTLPPMSDVDASQPVFGAEGVAPLGRPPFAATLRPTAPPAEVIPPATIHPEPLSLQQFFDSLAERAQQAQGEPSRVSGAQPFQLEPNFRPDETKMPFQDWLDTFQGKGPLSAKEPFTTNQAGVTALPGESAVQKLLPPGRPLSPEEMELIDWWNKTNGGTDEPPAPEGGGSPEKWLKGEPPSAKPPVTIKTKGKRSGSLDTSIVDDLDVLASKIKRAGGTLGDFIRQAPSIHAAIKDWSYDSLKRRWDAVGDNPQRYMIQQTTSTQEDNAGKLSAMADFFSTGTVNEIRHSLDKRVGPTWGDRHVARVFDVDTGQASPWFKGREEAELHLRKITGGANLVTPAESPEGTLMRPASGPQGKEAELLRPDETARSPKPKRILNKRGALDIGTQDYTRELWNAVDKNMDAWVQKVFDEYGPEMGKHIVKEMGPILSRGATGAAVSAAGRTAPKEKEAELPPDPLRDKALQMIADQKKGRKQQNVLYSEALAQKAERLGQRQNSAKSFPEFVASEGALAGELPKVGVENRHAFDAADLDEIMNRIRFHPDWQGKGGVWDQNHAAQAVARWIDPARKGALQPSEIGYLQKLFGDDVANEIPTGAEKFKNWRRAYRFTNMMSNPKSWLFVQLTGNTANGAMKFGEAALRNPLSVPARVAGAVSGVAEASSDFMKIWKTGELKEEVPGIDAGHADSFGGGLKNPANWVGRGPRAIDQFFYKIAKSSEMAAQVVNKAKGDPEAIARFTEKPSTEMEAAADSYAREAVFRLQKEGDFPDFMRKIQQAKQTGAAGEVLDHIVPFLMFASENARQGFNRTPGTIALRMLTKAGRESIRTDVPKALSEQLGTGSLLAVTGYMMAKSGRVNGAVPQDKEKRAQFYREGKMPWSATIYVPGVGERTVPLQYFGPMAFPFVMGAAIEDYRHDKGVLSDREVSGIANSLGKFALDQTNMRGASGFMEALSTGKWDRILADLISQYVPASGLQRGITFATDDVIRDPDGVLERLKAQTPVASKQVKPMEGAAPRTGGGIDQVTNALVMGGKAAR